MKSIAYGILTFLVGLILTIVLTGILSSGTSGNFTFIGMTVLFLSGTVVTCTFLTQSKTDKNTKE